VIIVVFGFLIGFFLVLIRWATSISGKTFRDVVIGFECGFDTLHVGKTPFSIRYFCFILLFLLFDVELVVFFHSPVGVSFNFFLLISLIIVVFGFLIDEKFIR
jgi:NADH:ubiquinone oxidoreductase subunit 3 (subunit A)